MTEWVSDWVCLFKVSKMIINIKKILLGFFFIQKKKTKSMNENKNSSFMMSSNIYIISSYVVVISQVFIYNIISNSL